MEDKETKEFFAEKRREVFDQISNRLMQYSYEIEILDSKSEDSCDIAACYLANMIGSLRFDLLVKYSRNSQK